MMNNEAQTKVEKMNAGKKRQIFITQQRPESEKSPYFELERKYDVKLAFHSLICLEPLSAKEFRQQKISIANFSGVIFTSRHAIDNFFRICEEAKVNISQDTKYFCATEAVALYLQKFILYRKRKVFYGADGTNKSLLDVINKHKENLNFLCVCSENQQDNEIVGWLKENECSFELGYMYRTKCNDIKQIVSETDFDIVCFFTPSGVRSWFENFPKFKQGKLIIGIFGNNTRTEALKFKLKPEIMAPLPQTPSMITALDKYLSGSLKPVKQ
ncbi:MAG: uroporphyrinogen-III synthase [Sphingobacteriales bacterium]|nr:uroporphyrinogen-III synthase [Sphingobacteriales bacterium]